MRGKRSRVALAALALVALALAAPAGAQAAKVTKTADGGALPGASGGGPTTAGEFTQAFKLSGKKVKGKQTLDVNVTLNATGGSPTALGETEILLIGPKGDNIDLTRPSGTAWVDLKLDDQSDLVACDPLFEIHSDCNYPQGGTFTGTIHSAINPTFKGLNPKGTWTLLFLKESGVAGVTIGTSTLEVKTGKKFAKEGR